MGHIYIYVYHLVVISQPSSEYTAFEAKNDVLVRKKLYVHA